MLYVRYRDLSGRGGKWFIPLAKFVADFSEEEKEISEDEDDDRTLWEWASSEHREDGDEWSDNANHYEIVEQG